MWRKRFLVPLLVFRVLCAYLSWTWRPLQGRTLGQLRDRVAYKWLHLLLRIRSCSKSLIWEDSRNILGLCFSFKFVTVLNECRTKYTISCSSIDTVEKVHKCIAKMILINFQSYAIYNMNTRNQNRRMCHF